jgi:pyridoxal phosphate enzyme (YggS family)
VADVAANVARVREQIAQAAQKAGRSPDDVELLAAVKYLEAPRLQELADAGVTLLGENRAQQLKEKADAYPGVFRWHFIGQLQSRKVKDIVPYVELIHSVASESALRKLSQHARAGTKILIEVNVAGEASKAGIAPEELDRYLEMAPVPVLGLMGMPPFAEDPEQSRPYFARLRQLAEERGLAELSMGTSQDFAVAVEEGATIVRIGSVLFG